MLSRNNPTAIKEMAHASKEEQVKQLRAISDELNIIAGRLQYYEASSGNKMLKAKNSIGKLRKEILILSKETDTVTHQKFEDAIEV